MVSSPEQVLADYRATSIRWAGERELVVKLTARRPSVNPPTGTVGIDTGRWLLHVAILDYPWGRMQLQYRYGEVEQYLLPETVSVSFPTFPIRGELAYTNYQLNVPIDPSVFSQTPAPSPAPSR